MCLLKVINMDFKMELSKRMGIIDSSLEHYLGVLKNEVQEDLYEAMTYSVFSGGKRLRSVILMEVFGMLGGEENRALPFACALEMIHAYSLIHDDLPAMDDDDMRRGKPTNHKVFGEGMAILAGDALLNRAYEIMADFCAENEGKHYLRAMSKIAKYAGSMGMVGGQALDIKLAGQRTDDKQLEFIYTKKTAKLFMAAFEGGALCADADLETLGIMEKIGLDFGFAFQALDDIDDNDPNAGRIAPPNMEGHISWIRDYEKGGFLADLIERIITQ